MKLWPGSPFPSSDARAARGDRQGVRRDPRRGLRRARRSRSPLHREHDRNAPAARRPRPPVLLFSRAKPAWVGRDRRALAGQDPREHGDRPQRHARPVGLDERPGHQLVDVGLGHGLDAGGVEALPQLRPPHVHQHPRQGQGPRLRDHADRPAPEVAPGLPAAADLQPAADGLLRVGRGVPRPRHRRPSATGAKPSKQLKHELKGMAAKARSQIVKDYVAFPLLSAAAAAGRRWRPRAADRRRGERAATLPGHAGADFSANISATCGPT